jgi:hypothetical protein
VAAAIVIVVALALLGACALLFTREPSQSVRIAALAGGAGGCAVALLLGFVFVDGGMNTIALGLMGAAVLPLVLLGQMRVVRMLTGG